MRDHPSRAVFLDKGSTLIDSHSCHVDTCKIRLNPGSGSALYRLQTLGYQLFVVSHQSDVGRGLVNETALAGVNACLRQLLATHGVRLRDFYYCPHWLHSMKAKYAAICQCQKPAPGLLLRAARQHGLDLRHCWMVGNDLDDVEAGRRACCHTVFLNNDKEIESVCSPLRRPHRLARGLPEAAEIIEQHLLAQQVRV